METISFPLYDDLKSRGHTQINWNILCPTINKLKSSQTEIIYALILHHYLLHNNTQNPINNFNIINSTTPRKNKLTPKTYQLSFPTLNNSDGSEKIPYSGKVCEGGKGIIYTLNQLPLELQDIIAHYILNLVS